MALSLRAGWAFDRFLLYGKAGFVWGKFNVLASQGETDTGAIEGITSQYLQSYSASQVLPGMLLGFGVEYAFTNNWTAKIEADYLNFSISDINYTGSFNCSIGCSSCSTATTFSQSGKFSGWASRLS